MFLKDSKERWSFTFPVQIFKTSQNLNRQLSSQFLEICFLVGKEILKRHWGGMCIIIWDFICSVKTKDQFSMFTNIFDHFLRWRLTRSYVCVLITK